MSIKNTGLVVSVCDALNGKILGTFDLNTYDAIALDKIINCLFERYVLLDQHGLLIKIGSSDF